MKKNIFFLLLCLVGMTLPMLAQNGRALFNYVENPSLNVRQQHFLQVIARNPVNVAFRLVTVNHDLFKSTAPILLNLDGLATAGRSEISIRQVDAEQRSQEEYSVAAPETLSIILLDNTGVTLQTIVGQSYHDAGSYHVEADLGQLPAGVYYIRYADSQRIKVVPVVKIGL